MQLLVQVPTFSAGYWRCWLGFGVYKASFETGWLRAILIAVLAWIIFIVLSFIFGALFGVAYPSPFFPTI